MSEESPTPATAPSPPPADAPMADDAPASTTTRSRPKLDLSAALGKGTERKKTRSMFGMLVGTLNKAAVEDKARAASEAARRRTLTEQRLQARLRRDAESVRKAEESKKGKAVASRKQEEVQLKDSLAKAKRRRLPLTARFLTTADVYPTTTEDMDENTDASSLPSALPNLSRAHPPPLFFLPAKLLPIQATLLERRKAEAESLAEKEWAEWEVEREAAIREISELREKAAADEASVREAREADKAAKGDAHDGDNDDKREDDGGMDVDRDDDGDEGRTKNDTTPKEKGEDDAMQVQADDEEAVEY